MNPDPGLERRCSTCEAGNPAGQKFCGECGTPLARGCPTCGATNPAGQKFCGECGTNLTAAAPVSGTNLASTTVPSRTPGPSASTVTSHAGAVAERRLVSVLFADLVGFTPFAAERDAEDVRETLTRYFDSAAELIARHGGTVEKFIGDAVMAVWGTPTAREDDAERAVRAALELVREVRTLGPEIQARAAVLTGEAAVTLGATNQGMVAGDLVNTASRLQGVALPGTVLVGEQTRRLTSEAIVFEPVGDQTLKGKVAPVPAWRAVRVVAERGGRGRAGVLEAPLIGRDEELRLIKDLYHATVREQRIRLVSVTGIGGTGKTRLAWEFEKYLDGIVGTTWWHHGRSPAYGEGITFWALGEMIRQRARLAESDDEATTRAKLVELVARVAADERERQWFLSAFLALLGIEPGRPDELFGAWRTFFERMSASGPVVLVFEDLHWADPGTLDFIDHLLEWSRNVPIYIVTLARPELLEKRPTWGLGGRNFTSLFLEPLPEAAIREVLAGLVPGLPEPTVKAIVDRAEGVPLYAIETVRMLVDDGHLVAAEDGTYQVVSDVTEVAVPPTLTALIAARLDALDAPDRALILDAAVLGQSFTVAGLSAVSGTPQSALEPRLKALSRSELLRREGDPLSPERGQHAFVQALVREVAYNTLSKKDRKDRHLAAARFFESLGTDEIAGAQAGHYLAAHGLAQAGPEQDALAAQARIALRGAADRAMALGAHEQAVDFLTQALTVTTEATEEAELYERAGESASIAGRWDDAQRLLRAAMERHRKAGNRSALARAAAMLIRSLLEAYRVEPAFEILSQVDPEVADLRDDPGFVFLEVQRGRAYYMNTEPRRAVETIDAILETAERLDLVPLIAEGLAVRGGALTELGRGYEGLANADAAMRLAEAQGLSHIALRARNTIGNFLAQREPQAAVKVFDEGIAEARRTGARGTLVRLTENVAELDRYLGRWDKGRDELEELLSGSLSNEDKLFALGQHVALLAWQGESVDAELAEVDRLAAGETDPNVTQGVEDARACVAFGQGRLVEARELLHVVARDGPWNIPTCIPLSATAAIWRKDAASAASDLLILEEAVVHGRLADARRARILAGIAGLEGRRQDAEAGFRRALEGARAIDARVDEALTAITMLTVLGPDHPEALAAGAAAREILKEIGAKPFLARLDELMAERGSPKATSRAAAAEAPTSVAPTDA